MVAIITGASSGIGYEFSAQLASRGHDLTVIARNADRLASLAKELETKHSVTVKTVSADLTTDSGVKLACQAITTEPQPIEILVNNAGMGLGGSFLANTAKDEEKMLALNVLSVMHLTHAALPVMLEHGQGTIINVSSVAGFGPVKPGSSYPASKAWVTNFSQSIDAAISPDGVRVMALCPGFVRTEFHERSNIDVGKKDSWHWLDPSEVVTDALADMEKGKSVSVPSFRYKTISAVVRHTPRALLRRLTSLRPH